MYIDPDKPGPVYELSSILLGNSIPTRTVEALLSAPGSLKAPRIIGTLTRAQSPGTALEITESPKTPKDAENLRTSRTGSGSHKSQKDGSTSSMQSDLDRSHGVGERSRVLREGALIRHETDEDDCDPDPSSRRGSRPIGNPASSLSSASFAARGSDKSLVSSDLSREGIPSVGANDWQSHGERETCLRGEVNRRGTDEEGLAPDPVSPSMRENGTPCQLERQATGNWNDDRLSYTTEHCESGLPMRQVSKEEKEQQHLRAVEGMREMHERRGTPDETARAAAHAAGQMVGW